MKKTLMAFFAHPDDESFAAGGTLARYAQSGARVVLVCATLGEAGIVHEAGVENPVDMGPVREKELRAALAVLGVQHLHLLGYRDSGMAGTPDNLDPRAFAQADPEVVVGQLVELVRLYRPQVMLTFGPEGGYGHPDHLAMHRYATMAWERVAMDEDPPRKLYYTAISRETFRRTREAMWRHGLLPTPPTEAEVDRRGAPEDRVTTTIDITDQLELKIEALRCHWTQLPKDHPWLVAPIEFRRQYMNREYFILAAARGLEIVQGEEDLFARLPFQ